MRIEYAHSLSQDEAYERISDLLTDLQSQYGDEIGNPRTCWTADRSRMDFSMEIMGFKTSGQVYLEDGYVTLEGKLPLVAKMFSSEIESMIRGQLDELLS